MGITASHAPEPPAGDPDGSVAEVRRLFEVQRSAYMRSPAPDLHARIGCLNRLGEVVGSNISELAAAISADFGHRSLHETYLLELVPVQNAIRHARQNIARWMRPERRRVSWLLKPALAWVQYQPVGVVGILAAWNYPLSLSLIPVVDALAAGNRVLIKPPDLTPHFSILLQRVLAQAFPEEEIAVVPGGPEVAEQFTHLPLGHLMFTGSTAVGRRVMAAAAENLTPVTLELGGKSPVLVCPDYGAAAAARDIAFPKLANAGQTCTAPDYVLAPAAIVRALASAILAEARKLYPSIPDDPNYTSIFSDRHYRRLRDAIEEARAGGAEILGCGQESRDAGRRTIAPTVVLHPPPECALMREEIFGPVLPIVGYETLDTAIEFVNKRERPLALYCLTHNRSHRNAVLGRTISGGVTINGLLLHNAVEDLPFGGTGSSGIGAYHGIAGFRRFSHARSICEVRVFNPLHFLTPPYGKLARLVIRLLGSRGASEAR
jgi:coniferyl-aldehyde dehydrogenase